MFLDLVLFVLGFVILIKGADILVDGSSSIAKKYGISNIVIGLTIVAFGTSTPELMVSIMASAKGSSAIALGNVLGSNITNTLLFFGIAALIRPLLIKNDTINKEIPLSLLAVIALGVLVNDCRICGFNTDLLSRADGLILILFFIIFMYYTFGISKTKQGVIESLGEEKVRQFSDYTAISMIIGGIFGLYFGGQWIVAGATSIAVYFGLSELFIGLTIIAIGTSLPELVASAVAAKKGHADMAVGNIIGTNIFNIFFVLGVSSIIRPISFSPALNSELIILSLITILLIFMIYIGKKNILDRREGIILVVMYFVYMIFLINRG
jgi:cation:H+ antiporter